MTTYEISPDAKRPRCQRCKELCNSKTTFPHKIVWACNCSDQGNTEPVVTRRSSEPIMDVILHALGSGY